MEKNGYPRGNPQEDFPKLQLWWAEELQKCGLTGKVVLEYAATASQLPQLSVGSQLFESLVMHRNAVPTAHMYHATLSGAPWPLETVVTTSASGIVVDIFYVALLRCAITGEVSFKKSIGWFSERFEVQGPGASSFENREPLLKQIKRALNRIYHPPQFGFVTSKLTFQLQEASMTLRPTQAGCEALIHTAACDESPLFGIGRTYSLGLAKTIEILKAVEQPT